MRSFENKVAVVTGAASGIGRALAQQLAQRGAALALVDVNAAALAETAASVAATGRRVTTHVADVADAARMEALAEEVVAQHGRVELLVNNAGVSVTGTLRGAVARRLALDRRRELLGCRARLQVLPAAPAQERRRRTS